MIKLIFVGEKIYNSGILYQQMVMDSLIKILSNNAHLKTTWSLDESVTAEMAQVPPYYTFDIRAFSERPFQFKENILRQYQSQMKICEITLQEGAHLMHAELDSASDGYICIDIAVPYVQFFFALNSDRQYYSNGVSLGKLAPGQMQAYLFYSEEIVGLWHQRAEDRFVEINIAIDLLEKWLPKNDGLWSPLRALLQGCQSGCLFAEPLTISSYQKNNLKELIGPTIGEQSLPLFCTAKLMELIARTSDQYNLQEFVPENDIDLSEDMRSLMAKAKLILENRMTDPPSLAQLSADLGTNENYLKKYFKMCYQTTIYGYVTKIRMQKAKDLLLKGERPIKDISRFLGYSNPAHFSASFKKHFGVMPRLIHRLSRGPNVE